MGICQVNKEISGIILHLHFNSICTHPLHPTAVCEPSGGSPPGLLRALKPSILPVLQILPLRSHQILTILYVLREPPFSLFDDPAWHIKGAQLLDVK